jgi:hypothetical protein
MIAGINCFALGIILLTITGILWHKVNNEEEK